MRKLLSKKIESETIAEKVDSLCWLCAGKPNGDGYVKFRIGNYITYAHRVSAWLWHGMRLDSPLLVRHQCIDRKACFNPAHLRLGTHYDNAQDMISQGRYRTRGALSINSIRRLIYSVRSGKMSVSRWAFGNRVAYHTAMSAFKGVTHAELARKFHKACDRRYGLWNGGANLFAIPQAEPVLVSPEDDSDYMAIAADVAAEEIPF